ncbi:hypothetical protein Csa_014372 [Cucumis sativus]|uniref:Uncharacterized protein n=1 Tax=Cucumis sativus TaxID=3659 RepID=A0A0A0LRQ4_CUCSA|nr:hypothetical protein Csa_014372 [Cucumis sativus]
MKEEEEEEEEKARKSLEMNGCYCLSTNFAYLSLCVGFNSRPAGTFPPFPSLLLTALSLSRSLAPSLADQNKHTITFLLFVRSPPPKHTFGPSHNKPRPNKNPLLLNSFLRPKPKTN